MKSTGVQVCLYMLILSAVRLAFLDRQEIREYQVSRNLRAIVPLVGSLVGIDAQGNEVRPSFGRSSFLNSTDYLLVFPIHADNAARDVQFWNRVIDLVRESHPTPNGRTEYWGICDYGQGCNSLQPTAQFRIIGFLDLYEMRVAAEADIRHQALLYDHLRRLSAHIQIADDPSVVSKLVMQEIR